jgi:hypothetical protein
MVLPGGRKARVTRMPGVVLRCGPQTGSWHDLTLARLKGALFVLYGSEARFPKLTPPTPIDTVPSPTSAACPATLPGSVRAGVAPPPASEGREAGESVLLRDSCAKCITLPHMAATFPATNSV